MRGVQLGRVLLIAGLINVIGLAANAATSFATDQANGALRWLLPPAVALAAALLTAVVQSVGAAAPERGPQAAQAYPPPPRAAQWPPPSPPGAPAPPSYGPASPASSPGLSPYGPPSYEPPSYGPPSYRPSSAPPQPSPTRPRRKSAPIAILVILLVCGVGALTVTVGVRYAVSYVTGNETGVDRLVRPAAARAGTLSLRVDRVEYTPHFTRVDLVASNAGGGPVSLLLFGNCVLTGEDGTTLQADDFRSRWSTTVPPGGTQRGTVTFGGTLPDGVTRAALSFSTVFSAGGGSITVRTIELRPG